MDLFNSRDRIYKKTIKDFGSQWKIHGQIRDTHWASDEMFRDHFGSDFIPAALSEKNVCEIGSGSGRIIEMLRRYNPSHITGVEPSQNALSLSVKYQSEPKITILNEEGESFKAGLFDFIFILGVLHHINRPIQVLQNAYNHLEDGGHLVIWVYGYENNQAYIFIQKGLRLMTQHLNDRVLDVFSLGLSFLVDLYGYLSRKFFRDKLPLSNYLRHVYGRCSRLEKKYIIFDQLNPAYAKYYKLEELRDLLWKFDFKETSFHHRHGYSWTVVCKK